MKISYNWLKDYLNINIDPEIVSNYLTDIGLEVEKLEQIESIKGGLKGIIIGEVVNKEKHPNADRLNLTTVDLGLDENIQIVCGAPNVDVGQKVPVATVGTYLYSGENKFKIKKSKIRGEESVGMICSESELGLGDDDDGIMILDINAKVGRNLSDHFDIENDTIFHIGLTPNRTDAMSHIGVARDLKCFLNTIENNNLTLCLPNINNYKNIDNLKKLNIEINDSKLCPRYSAVLIKDIVVKDSPDWLKTKLKSIGLVPINNIVDITNFVLHEIGQPLHAFDYSKIKDEKIIVKTFKDKKSFTTLDNNTLSLSTDDLMICDSNDPLCIAGVFGGLSSGVSNETNEILLESAYFNPTTVRKTAKRHNLSTDASFRYERGCDPNITIYALKRAVLLIQEITNGTISSEIFDFYPNKINKCKIVLHFDNLNNLVGEKISVSIVKSILNDLEICILEENNHKLVLEIPTYRYDVTREIDVIEEILRIYGFNNITISKNLNSVLPSSSFDYSISNKNLVSNLLSNNGFFEMMNNSLTSSKFNSLVNNIDNEKSIGILNPLSEDLNILRQSILLTGLQSISHNINRNNKDLKFYEFGKTYIKQHKNNIENSHLLLIMTGKEKSENWNNSEKSINFYSLKENVNSILDILSISNFNIKESSENSREYGLDYLIKGNILVKFGKLSSHISTHFDLNQDIYYADFNWDLINKNKNTKQKYESINKYPEIRRDLSLLICDDIDFSIISSIISKMKIQILKEINLFDVYTGKNLPSGKKSYSISLIFADKSRTLTDFEIDKIMNTIIDNFEKQGFQLR